MSSNISATSFICVPSKKYCKIESYPSPSFEEANNLVINNKEDKEPEVEPEEPEEEDTSEETNSVLPSS